MLAVPLVPEVTLMSLETITDVTGAKKTTALKFGGGFVTEIWPLLPIGQPNNTPLRQYVSSTPLGQDIPPPKPAPANTRHPKIRNRIFFILLSPEIYPPRTNIQHVPPVQMAI